MSDFTHYTYRVIWSAEDGEFVGQVAEFPSLSWLASTQADALQGVVNLVEDVIEEMERAGEPVPEPFSERRYSGEFKVRIPPELHRSLAIQAAEEHVSLNRLVSARLAS
ncbi:type II toxin-antitoxin system HicB family antitoxin [Leifsonia sp. C5G2]|uniref:type II toxin-antitoxin system HicB family antitoxin n=1 Tax=Leifsonia sp. C5G2 TaxID=2735269 RepID=UPI001585CFCF|nr:type II toxin-antitoxin system HicB family antitoxin [Leifsonia sp. C5G2]NUU06872.1 type II toxin-antitoxin system HicB family antitoxin [Leifsonia sp. C5G2]